MPSESSPRPSRTLDPALDDQATARRSRLLRAIFDAEPQCVKLLGLDGSLRMMNPAGLRMIEAESLDEVRGASIFELIAEEHRDAFRALTKKVFHGGSGSLKFRMTGLKGTPRWLETHAVPLVGESGRVAVALGITCDITDQVLADEALHQSERNFRMLFEQATDGIVVCDDEMRFLDVNPAGCRIMGYAREELLGMSLADLLPTEERGRLASELAQLTGGEPVTTGWRAARRDGATYVVEVTAKRLSDGRVQAFVRDVTERVALQTQLLQAQKMESLGRLAGGVAHDFNNLLTVINGTVDLIMAGLHGGSPLRGELDHVRQAGERAATLTRQLLAMSRQQILQPEVIDLNAIVVDMQNMLQRLIGEDLRIVLHLAGQLWNVRADPAQIEQVILNLAVNARDAMPDGGTITIETRNVVPGASPHQPQQREPHVMLAVRDTGVGMDEAARKRVFDPFFTTKDIGKGTGLGLSTVYGVIKQSGGTVWVDSRPGAGATFTVYLPKVDTAPAARPKADPLPAAAGTETILLVEDERALRSLTRRILESAGYRVVDAGNGVEALQLLDRLADPIHLLVTDIVMPGMNGRELATRALERRPDIKVLYTTGYTTDALLRRGVVEATSRLVTKPFTAQELRRRIRETLDAS